MSERLSDLEQPSPLDWLQIALMCGSALFAALALGAVQPWSEQVVIVLAAGLAGVCAWRAYTGATMGGWVFIPVGLMIAVAALQIVPMPAGLAALLSPGTTQLRRELLDDLPNLDRLLSTTTLSLYPEAGWHDLRLMLAAVAFFVSAGQLARSRSAMMWLGWGMALVGLLIAGVALGHQLAGEPAIYGRFLPPRQPARAAPFINHSHFAQFMNLSLGFALGTGLSGLMKFRASRGPRGGSDWLQAILRGELRVAAVAFAAAGVIAVACALSGSRGGMLSLAAAASVTGIVGWSRGQMRSAALALPVLAALMIAAVLAGSDHLQSRVASRDVEGDRLTILKSLIPAWQTFPLLGTGLGTFEVVYPMYDQTSAINLFTHAENEYAQTLTETGFVGLAVVVAFIVMVMSAHLRVVKRGGRSGQFALGLGFGLIAILVHSMSDFGQHIPANFILTATICGLLIGLAGRNRAGEFSATTTWGRRAGSLVSGGLCAGLLLAAWQADTVRRATAENAHAVAMGQALAKHQWLGEDETFTRMLASAGRAVEHRPGNVLFRYDQNLLRWFALTRNDSGVLPRDEAGEVDPFVVEQAKQIMSEFRAARVVCPTFGPACSMEGQIALALGLRQRGEMLLARAMRLTAYDGVTIAYNADLAMRAGDVERARELYVRAIARQGIDHGEVMRRYIEDYGRPDLALELAGDTRWLLELVTAQLRRAGYPDLALVARQRWEVALQKTADQPSAAPGPLYDMAIVLRDRGDPAGAVPYLRRAVFGNPENAAWRLELARLLAATGDYREALDEAEAARRYQPSGEAAALIEEYRRRAATMPGN